MKNRNHTIFLLVLILLVPINSGCIKFYAFKQAYPNFQGSTLGSLSIQHLSEPEIRSRINNEAEPPSSLKLSGSFSVIQLNTAVQTYPVIILFNKPSFINVQAYTPLIPVVFNLKSTASDFWFHLPKENIIYTGELDALADNPDYELNIDPLYLRKALFPEKLSETNEISVETLDDRYVVSVFTKNGTIRTLERTLWLDRHSATVSRVLYYSSQGIPTVEIFRQEFRQYEGIFIFPRIIRIINLRKKTTVEFIFDKIRPNEKITESIFSFSFPEGVTIEKIEQP